MVAETRTIERSSPATMTKKSELVNPREGMRSEAQEAHEIHIAGGYHQTLLGHNVSQEIGTPAASWVDE